MSEAAKDEIGYALGLANESYTWYKKAAIRSRQSHKISETAILVISTMIPAVAVIFPGNSILPALLGAVVVLVTGLRAIFHWQDNYLRFSAAREAVEAERRLYLTKSAPYDDEGAREQMLAAAVTRIEQGEMGNWLKIAQSPPKT